ncbi:transposase IS3/IS911 family protein [Alteromonas mediterranea DE1]|uniref:Transposase ISAfe5 n=1 Tax=Alteromonas mediterranea (strain DSM 17117 / CIP 110805 / LMG 28347 / Deep ecotype) TaxID=1774373 RepID=F2G6L2_ALTMD|nr:transposase [Alteromonas mediterranea]AEA97549.1 transposase ISAfe5 [Alteromonas mediterranea DE]AFV84407.1 transposase IS3/IS911 family protein [Alteromonas mediterranea DE1]AGP85234.1 transposase IS3/IS911 family protein [Alteromonas mediterranea U4]AGP89711.1 transposase IS3/IS911 family protein [Alteromonas mediterranea U7]AGP96414.1 transposase IS3/IS911 family protein [Alteromonas mediterranea UM7]MED5378135.1 transposase [Pseudomonadota bacterium]
MRHYPEEHKKAVVSKLIESGLSLRQFAQREGISLSTLYGWRDKYTEADFSLTKSNTPENWTAEQKFSAVIETAAMSEVEVSEYCRKKGLFPEQIQQWKHSCISGNQSEADKRKQQAQERKADKKRIKELERELKRKDAALAETAALLVLRKKLNAYWGEDEDN